MQLLKWAALFGALLAFAISARAQAANITTLRVEGARRTRLGTLEALLPQPLPAELLGAQLREFERRVRNLGIFDAVDLKVDASTLVLKVREKFTLSPTLEFSSGATALDSYALVGATEYNLLGTASALSVFASWEQRGLNGVVGFSQHPYARERWGVDLTAYFTSADFRFAHEDIPQDGAVARDGWLRHQAGLDAMWKLPFTYEGSFRVALGAFALREWVSRVADVRAPQTGVWTGLAAIAEADLYSFHDLVPWGWRSTFEVYPSLLLPSGQPRPEVIWTTLFAKPLWKQAVITGRTKASGVWGGNVNHSMLLGSLEGVRGLADAFYRNRAQAFANLELRQSFMLATRWAWQAVGFADAAAFQPMDREGRTQAVSNASAAGFGIRLVPLFLTGIVLRLDMAKPLKPQGAWFVQFALSQYF